MSPPLYDNFAFIWRRGAQLSAATRALLRLAEDRMAKRVAELDAIGVPRQRAAGGR
jgi:hypothetical protein